MLKDLQILVKAAVALPEAKVWNPLTTELIRASMRMRMMRTTTTKKMMRFLTISNSILYKTKDS